MKILDNGIYREMTDEEQKDIQTFAATACSMPPSLEERTCAIEAAILSLLGGGFSV